MSVRSRMHEFDVLHFHVDMIHFPFFEHCAERTLTTLHGRLDLKDLPVAYRRWRQFPLASISMDQRKPLRTAHWVGSVHHGMPAGLCPFNAHPTGDYLAFLGRISPEKRVDRAIRIARRVGLPLKIAAKIDAQDKAYFEQEIEPLARAFRRRVRRRDQRRGKAGVPRQRAGAAVPDRLARALRHRDDRSDGVRHARSSRGGAVRCRK